MTEKQTMEIRTMGLSERELRERLADLWEDPAVSVALTFCEGEGALTVTVDAPLVAAYRAQLEERIGDYVYSYDGESLAQCVVRLLTRHGLTVATAESCTGGMIAASITDVAGASRVFGTGVVSYSNECKQAQLKVDESTIQQYGAVSDETARQMAVGVRQLSAASIGVSVTGEAGPVAAEDKPVGTVFMALADKKRTWVEEWHLEGSDRASIRRQAAQQVLWLLWRYLTAYPMVMAGGESRHAAPVRQIPRTRGAAHPRLLSRLLPWKSDPLPRLLLKLGVWLVLLAVMAVGLLVGYQYLFEPHRNRELQDNLGDVYHNETADLTVDSDSRYPEGMMITFRGLYDMNTDIGGWLRIPDTAIDYPVMHYENGFYRTHSFLKQLSIYGQLYFGPDDDEGKYTRVYGQNTEDGQMFSELLHYRRIAYLQEHPYIECNTLYKATRWEIFAVLVTDDRDENSFAVTEDVKDYADFIADIQRRSLFLSDTTVTEEDRFLLLSTSAQTEYDFTGARLVVVAKERQGEGARPTYQVNEDPLLPEQLRTAEGDGRVAQTK